jgi:hypothetical protein
MVEATFLGGRCQRGEVGKARILNGGPPRDVKQFPTPVIFSNCREYPTVDGKRSVTAQIHLGQEKELP